MLYLAMAGGLAVAFVLACAPTAHQDFSPNRKTLFYDGPDILDGMGEGT